MSTTVKIDGVYITHMVSNGTEEIVFRHDGLLKKNEKNSAIPITFGSVSLDRKVVSALMEHKITFDDLFTGNALLSRV